MGLFELLTRSSQGADEGGDLVSLYRRLSPLRLTLNNQLVARLSADTFNQGAKKLGMLRGGTLVFDNEDQTSVLMDYCVYDVRRQGRNAVDQYLCDCPPEPDTDEMVILRAMQRATYTLVAIRDIERGVGCRVVNLFTEESLLMIDLNLSKSGQRGLVLATRLLDFGDFVTTSGAALPLGVFDEQELDAWQSRLQSGGRDDSFDPASLIRESLRGGGSERIAYVEAVEDARPGVERPPTQPQSAIFASQRPARDRRRPIKDRSRQRCDCGSGKMFKNCCGRP